MTRDYTDSQGVPLPDGYSRGIYHATSEADYDATIVTPTVPEPPAPPPTVDELEGAPRWSWDAVEGTLYDAQAARERRDHMGEWTNYELLRSLGNG